MPLTSENACALVGGAVPSKETDMKAQQPATQPATVRVRVLRAFQDHRGKVLDKESETDLPRLFALEMQAANKAKIIPAPDPATSAAAKPSADGGRKGDSNHAR